MSNPLSPPYPAIYNLGDKNPSCGSSAGDFTNGTIGSIQVADGTHKFYGVPNGTTGQVLISGGANSIPTWTNTLTGLSVSGSLTESGLIITPVTPVTVAASATVNLSATQTYNILRPTSDATITGAVINLPSAPVDGQRCTVSTTAAITTVTGTISSAPIPVLAAMTAGQTVTYVYNLAATVWLRG